MEQFWLQVRRPRNAPACPLSARNAASSWFDKRLQDTGFGRALRHQVTCKSRRAFPQNVWLRASLAATCLSRGAGLNWLEIGISTSCSQQSAVSSLMQDYSWCVVGPSALCQAGATHHACRCASSCNLGDLLMLRCCLVCLWLIWHCTQFDARFRAQSRCACSRRPALGYASAQLLSHTCRSLSLPELCGRVLRSELRSCEADQAQKSHADWFPNRHRLSAADRGRSYSRPCTAFVH